MRKIERQLNLLSFLYSLKRPVSLEEIGDKVLGYQGKTFEALHQMFHRDKKELIELGIQIDYIGNVPESERGYLIPLEKRYLPDISFSPEEIIALQSLFYFLAKQRGYPFQENLESALLKISSTFPESEINEEKARESFPRYFDFSSRYHERVAQYVEILDEAIRNRKRITFSYYYIQTGETSQRKVDPYHIFYERWSWYLVGFCHLHQHIRTYKVERMRNLKIITRKSVEPDFEIPQDFRPEKYHDIQPWEYEQDEEEQVKVWLSPKVSFWVKRIFKNSLELKDFPDGSSTVKVRVFNLSNFIDFALTLGNDIEILEPTHLRKEMKKILKSIESLY